jgi:hypothetical protein
MATHKTVFDTEFKKEDAYNSYEYQKDLTTKLDTVSTAFDQNTINEIVLWKVNRYANIDINTLNLINTIDINSNQIDIEKTENILKALLRTKGIRLPMASTILRFKNKNIYQIIDQRVYRIIYKEKKLLLKNLKPETLFNDSDLNQQIELYLQYLKDLKTVCEKLEIDFENLIVFYIWRINT